MKIKSFNSTTKKKKKKKKKFIIYSAFLLAINLKGGYGISKIPVPVLVQDLHSLAERGP